MPMTNKEKMARKRERLKNDPEKRAAALEKDRIRKKAARKKFEETATEKELREFRRKEANRVLDYINKTKKKTPGNLQATPEKVLSSPFGSRQSLGKAIKRAGKNLPNSPRKKNMWLNV